MVMIDDRTISTMALESYEREADRMIEEVFGHVEKPDRTEALKDVKKAIELIRQARDCMDESMTRGADETYNTKADYYAQVLDNLAMDLSLEDWA